MKYRKLSADNDFVFGKTGSFLENSPETVAQAVKTRLALLEGEWFLDTTAGVPYETQIIGKGNLRKHDAVIKAEIIGTQGFESIVSYASTVDRASRQLSIVCTIATIYGETTLQARL